MLKKLIAIKNVGKFRNCSAAGDIEFRKLSLIFGENSRGKTTLASLLRSLQSGDANHVLERRTLGSANPPLIEVLAEGGKLIFKDGAWSSTYPNLAVFDSHFVSQNVYSGDYIEHEHKKNLARIVVGEQGVTLARKVDDLDADIRTANNQVNSDKTACEKHVPQGITLDEFLKFVADAEIDAKIARKQQEVAAIANADTIKTKAAFNTLSLPSPPTNLDALLGKDIAGVSKDAEAKVRQQIDAHHMGAAGQGWLSQGLQFIQQEACPFCGQSINANECIAAYRSFFSESYRNFKNDLVVMDRTFRESLSDAKILPVQNTLTQNEALTEFWKQYIAVGLPALSFERDVAPVLSGLRETLSPYLTKKLEAPLEVVTLGPDVTEARRLLNELTQKVTAYTQAVAAANAAIAEKRKESAAGNLAAAKKELLLLEGQKRRHSPEAIAACDAYQQSTAKKQALDDQKKKAKTDLDTYTEQVITKYETSINGLLKRFCAGFRITGSRLQYVGGTTSSAFKLSINDVPVELGDDKTPPGTPCFRSTLGAGDRNTLALAFFLVQLRERKDLADLTVVFDDPFTSLDSFRQHATRDQIRHLTGLAKQVIVLSHYPQFLQLVADEFDQAQLRLLWVAREGKSDSEIRPWDMSATLARGFDQDIATLAAFHHGEAKDLRSVMRCIRPVLEAYIRGRHPTCFPENANEWLGGMLSRIRDANDDDAVAELKAHYDDLSSMNDYTKRYHHDDNTAKADAGPIQEIELQGAVELTLELIGRL